MKYSATEEEIAIRAEIRKVYNSGDCKRAVEMSIDFRKNHPDCLLARYCFAVMQGDYALTAGISPDEKARLLQIGKAGIKELFDDPDRPTWPHDFGKSVRNEYYWIFELPEEQYKLGLEDSANDPNKGLYSMCVGASMMALKSLRERKLDECEKWAKISLENFAKFELFAPDWYNINYFSAQAFACLGQFEESAASFNDMFRKQKAAVDLVEVKKFEELVGEIEVFRAQD